MMIFYDRYDIIHNSTFWFRKQLPEFLIFLVFAIRVKIGPKIIANLEQIAVNNE